MEGRLQPLSSRGREASLLLATWVTLVETKLAANSVTRLRMVDTVRSDTSCTVHCEKALSWILRLARLEPVETVAHSALGFHKMFLSGIRRQFSLTRGGTFFLLAHSLVVPPGEANTKAFWIKRQRLMAAKCRPRSTERGAWCASQAIDRRRDDICSWFQGQAFGSSNQIFIQTQRWGWKLRHLRHGAANDVRLILT